MVKNIWKMVSFVCGCHEEEIKMTEKIGHKNLFYSCPKYYPENREKNERACANNVAGDDVEKIVEQLSKIIEEEIATNPAANLTNYSFKLKSYELKVLEHTKDNIKISVKNKKALA